MIVYQATVMVFAKRRKQTIEIIAMRTVIVYQASVREGTFSLFLKDAALPEEMTS